MKVAISVMMDMELIKTLDNEVKELIEKDKKRISRSEVIERRLRESFLVTRIPPPEVKSKKK